MEGNLVPLTKQKIKAILKEEVDTFIKEQDELSVGHAKQIDMLEKLLKAINNLDLSIDYLTAGLTDDTPMGIGLSQSTLGRLAKAQKAPLPAQPAAPARQERD